MTVVNPKSISGITSITTASGSDNLLTIHTSDANNTERLRIDSTGTTKIVTGIVTTLTATTGIVTTLTTNTLTANSTTKVGSGVTLSPDGDIFATGVTTTGSLVSNGAISGTTGTFSGAVSGTTGTFSGAISGTTGTFSGTATFNDTHLDIADSIRHIGDSDTKIRFPDADTFTVETSGSERLRITSAGLVGIGTNSPENDLHIMDGSATLKLTSTTSANSTRLILESEADSYGGIHFGDPSDEDAGRIRYYHGGSSPNHMQFSTNATEHMRIHSGGVVSFNSGIELGSGLDATAANTLDDYEEGSYIPSISASGVTYTYGASNDYTLRSPHSVSDSNTISYVKIGSMVYLQFTMFWNSNATIRYLITLPFTAKGSAYALCITPASFQVDVDGDMLGTLGNGNNSTAFDTYRILKDTGTGGHGNVPLNNSSEVYYQICYQAYA